MHPFPVDQAHSAPVRAQARNCQRRQPTNRRKRPCVATVISSRRYHPAATKRLSTMQRRYVPACIYREELGQINNTRWRKSADHQEQLWLIALVFLRSEENTSELQSIMRISYADYSLKKTKKIINNTI